jgi:dihydropteroate synthase
MQENTHYEDILGEVEGFLSDRVDIAVAGGIARQRLAVDPGLGFGKNTAGNFSLIRNVGVFTALGLPVVIGASRKSFIWKSLGLKADEALEGSLAVAVLAAARGAQILRVHDVVETVRALRMTRIVEDASVMAAESQVAE